MGVLNAFQESFCTAICIFCAEIFARSGEKYLLLCQLMIFCIFRDAFQQLPEKGQTCCIRLRVKRVGGESDSDVKKRENIFPVTVLLEKCNMLRLN